MRNESSILLLFTECQCSPRTYGLGAKCLTQGGDSEQALSVDARGVEQDAS